MMDDGTEARRKAEIGLDKVMSGNPAEQRKGNELIDEATSLEPDAVEEVRQEIRQHAQSPGTLGG